jgi:hypothetical protein
LKISGVAESGRNACGLRCPSRKGGEHLLEAPAMTQNAIERDLVVTEIVLLVADAANRHEPISPQLHTKMLLAKHPHCGISEYELMEMILNLAVEKNLPIDTIH